MEGFKNAYFIHIRNEMKEIEKEIKVLKEEFSLEELNKLFDSLLKTLGTHCLCECKVFECRKCRVRSVIGLLESKITKLERIKALELRFLELFNEYAEYVIEGMGDDIKELTKEVLSDK